MHASRGDDDDAVLLLRSYGSHHREAGSPLTAGALAAAGHSLGASGSLGRGSMDMSPSRHRPPIARLSSGKLQQLAAHQLRQHYAAAGHQQVRLWLLC